MHDFFSDAEAVDNIASVLGEKWWEDMSSALERIGTAVEATGREIRWNT